MSSVYSVGKIESFEYESEGKNGRHCVANGYEEKERKGDMGGSGEFI